MSSKRITKSYNQEFKDDSAPLHSQLKKHHSLPWYDQDEGVWVQHLSLAGVFMTKL